MQYACGVIVMQRRCRFDDVWVASRVLYLGTSLELIRILCACKQCTSTFTRADFDSGHFVFRFPFLRGGAYPPSACRFERREGP